ncbi:hypothetical protein U1622_12220 [Leptospira interrogans]
MCGSSHKEIQKEFITQSDFCTKPLFCDHDQNLNPILTRVWLRKNFLKVVFLQFQKLFIKS